jgi:hypothetical protein
MRRTAIVISAAIGVLVSLAQPASAAPIESSRWAVSGQGYNHLGNPSLGQVRSDAWVDNQFQSSDIGTEPYLLSRVRATSRAVKISRALRVQVDVSRLEDVHGNVISRNANAVNSGTASSATQVSPWADVSPFEWCLEFDTRSPLRVRTQFSIRWTDGTVSRVTRVGPWTNAGGGPQWCYP